MNARSVATAGMPARWALSDGTVEVLKWLAFAAMLVDHINVTLLDRGEPWMFAIGRLAMPIFAVVFGYNLSRSREPRAVINRMVAVGLLVQPICMLTINQGQLLPLNILLTFAAGAALVHLWDRRFFAHAIVLAVVAFLAMDYSYVGVGLVAASWLYFRSRDPVHLIVLAFLSVGLWSLNGTAWGFAGFAVVLLAGWVRLNLPRHRWALLTAYPGHLVLLAILASI